MAGDESFYEGASFYGRNANYGNFIGVRQPSSAFSISTDPRTANQLKAVSEKISSGVKAVEIEMLQPDVAESIPNQHLEELNRLRKLTGVDLTLHGPLIEPTGVKGQGWDESQRQQAERQIWSAVDRANKLDPKGNVVVTIHASNGLPEAETRVFNTETKKEEIKSFWVVDERTGQFTNLPLHKHYLAEEKKETESLYEEIDNKIKSQNGEIWYKSLQNINFHANNGASIINQTLHPEKELGPEFKKIFEKRPLQEIYKDYVSGNREQVIKLIEDPRLINVLDSTMTQLTHGDIYLRDAYAEFQNLFDQAYDAALRNKNYTDIKKLDEFRKELVPSLNKIEDPQKIDEFGREIIKGVNVLRSLSEPPRIFRPLREFALEKASETFANTALQAYDKFKEHAPIISIENPPIGSGISRAEELKELVKKSREVFVKKAASVGLSESEAKKEAERLIGATWDVGHINMLRKYGYGVEHLKEQTKTIAPFVKHIHLSDNFGMEHTELPMGMGNVPIKEHMELIKGYGKQVEKIKKVIEAGNWYQHFQTTPFAETLSAFGSPIYAMKMAPYWNQAAGLSGNYFAGYGAINPDIHHSIYGTGFSNLPPELGGQMSGKNRLSGSPME